MGADGERRGRAAGDDGGLARLQSVPRDQREGLAVLVAESHERGGERGTFRDVVGVVGGRRGERIRRVRERRVAAAGVVAPSPVGELFAGRGQEPGERVVSGGHVLEPSPCHREGLGHHVACLLLVGAAQGVAEHATEELVPELLEPRHSLRVRTPSSHHPGDVAAGRILTSARGGSEPSLVAARDPPPWHAGIAPSEGSWKKSRSDVTSVTDRARRHR